MARSKTGTFVTEIPLVVDSKTEAELLSRFQAARQLYNACLNEAMVRMNLVRNSEGYTEAKKIPLERKKERSLAFNKARAAYRYSDYDLQAYASLVSNRSKWIAQKIDSNTQQTIATRAFKASEKVLFGRARKVRRQIRVLQRKMERSRRSLNPDNYHPNFEAKKGRKTVVKKGQPKKGLHKWNNSRNYQRTAAKKRELERKKTAYAKSVNRKVVNEILRHGKQIKTENVSVKGWQKRYGKAISAKAVSNSLNGWASVANVCAASSSCSCNEFSVAGSLTI